MGAAFVLLAGAAPASAHTPEVDATCSALTVTLENYAHSPVGETPNVVVVTIDGVEVANTTFGATFNGSYSYDGTTTGHTYTVAVDAVDKAYDRDFAGTTDVCPVAEPPVVVPPVEPPVVVPPVEPPVVETPPVAETPPMTDLDSTPVADELPATGIDMGSALPLATGLLLAGVALTLVRRSRRA
ncbi:LPXTG cell wall anchor domain-containing protein [Mycetocola zhadangensis]|uniref:LPXTG cell wall anchor domain-containing protein n=1 Tax=Mycetocola zhadangensis TaxID=1164595 RepID=UPI003A4E413F